MKKLFMALFSTLLLVGLGQSPLTAQNTVVVASPSPSDHNREGLWFNIGVGYGTSGCGPCTERDGGLSGGLSAGTTLSDNVLIGGGLTGWRKSSGAVTVSARLLTPLVRVYPWGTEGFFLTGGVGVGWIDFTLSNQLNRSPTRSRAWQWAHGSANQVGYAGLAGLGYDIRVGNHGSLTPFLNGFYINGDENVASINVVQFGVGATVH